MAQPHTITKFTHRHLATRTFSVRTWKVLHTLECGTTDSWTSFVGVKQRKHDPMWVVCHSTVLSMFGSRCESLFTTQCLMDYICICPLTIAFSTKRRQIQEAFAGGWEFETWNVLYKIHTSYFHFLHLYESVMRWCQILSMKIFEASIMFPLCSVKSQNHNKVGRATFQFGNWDPPTLHQCSTVCYILNKENSLVLGYKWQINHTRVRMISLNKKHKQALLPWEHWWPVVSTLQSPAWVQFWWPAPSQNHFVLSVIISKSNPCPPGPFNLSPGLRTLIKHKTLRVTCSSCCAFAASYAFPQRRPDDVHRATGCVIVSVWLHYRFRWWNTSL